MATSERTSAGGVTTRHTPRGAATLSGHRSSGCCSALGQIYNVVPTTPALDDYQTSHGLVRRARRRDHLEPRLYAAAQHDPVLRASAEHRAREAGHCGYASSGEGREDATSCGGSDGSARACCTVRRRRPHVCHLPVRLRPWRASRSLTLPAHTAPPVQHPAARADRHRHRALPCLSWTC